MGEAGDKLSESSVSELNKKIANVQNKEETLGTIKSLLSQIPSSGGDDNEMQKGEQLRQQAFNFDPDHYVTEDVQKQLLDLLRWRDQIMRKVDSAVEHIPGLEDVVEQLTEAMNVCEFAGVFFLALLYYAHYLCRHLYYGRAICEGKY
jgi:hypothetical protein